MGREDGVVCGVRRERVEGFGWIKICRELCVWMVEGRGGLRLECKGIYGRVEVRKVGWGEFWRIFNVFYVLRSFYFIL